MNNKISLYIKTLVMVVFVMFGVLVIFSSNIFPISADYTKKSEKPITTPSQNQPHHIMKKTENSFSN